MATPSELKIRQMSELSVTVLDGLLARTEQLAAWLARVRDLDALLAQRQTIDCVVGMRRVRHAAIR